MNPFKTVICSFQDFLLNLNKFQAIPFYLNKVKSLELEFLIYLQYNSNNSQLKIYLSIF